MMLAWGAVSCRTKEFEYQGRYNYCQWNQQSTLSETILVRQALWLELAMSSCVRPGAHDAGFRGRRKARHAVQAGTNAWRGWTACACNAFVAQLSDNDLTKTTMFSLASTKRTCSNCVMRTHDAKLKSNKQEMTIETEINRARHVWTALPYNAVCGTAKGKQSDRDDHVQSCQHKSWS